MNSRTLKLVANGPADDEHLSATVTSVNTAAHTVAILFAGASTAIAGVPYVSAAYTPTVGDRVLVFRKGSVAHVTSQLP